MEKPIDKPRGLKLMSAICSCPLPSDSLLRCYLDSGAYTDCYAAEIPGKVTHAEFVEAFYTTRLFKLERLILRLVVARPSTDAEAKQLAEGTLAIFAAWSVEGRAPNQLLLCDNVGRTRSWLMVSYPGEGRSERTELYFGSAVVPIRSKKGESRMGFLFRGLMGFHKLYSRLLLGAARARLSR